MYGVRRKPKWIRGRKRTNWQQQEGTPTLVYKLLKRCHTGAQSGGFWRAWNKQTKRQGEWHTSLPSLALNLPPLRASMRGSAGAKKHKNSLGVPTPPCAPREGGKQEEVRVNTGGELFPLYLASSLLSSLLVRMGWEPSTGCWTQLLSWSPTRQPGVSLSVRRQHIQ